MLQPMQQPAPTQSSPTFSSFAGLLSTLASPPPDAAADTPLWNESDLGEDVAMLSYERALRAHARYRPADRNLDRGDQLPKLPGGPDLDTGADAAIEADAAGAIDVTGAAVAADAVRVWQPAVATDRDLRTASVTIRLSQAECARLHQRAAEAGLTVSAYLRSCALEAETLRAQVKQALAKMNAGSKPPQQAQIACRGPRQGAREQGNEKAGQRDFFGWIGWLARRGR